MVCPREDIGLWESVSARAARIPNLEFIERVPYHEIQSVYDDAKIFVNTSEWEGWPNSFIQSGLGAAALLSLQVNPDRLFETYALGRFCDGEFGGMERAARGMLGSPEELGKMQRESERFVAELHDNPKEAAAFLAGLGKSELSPTPRPPRA
jgi:glycosyltransferase involved in cell wall biosynthesis